jgi:predicted nucleotidyltransferase
MRGIKKKIRNNRYLRWTLIASNWLFQGIPNADKTEQLYKISFTLFFTTIFFLIFYCNAVFSLINNLLLSLFVAHSVNWCVNGNVYVLLIHRLCIAKLSKVKLFVYFEGLQQRLSKQNWILYSASFGSICRGELKEYSDIDISIVRKPGFLNGIKALFFSVVEKKRADWLRVPLELYINDNPDSSKKRFNAENNPVVLCDPYGTISKHYSERLTVAEAKQLNGVL